MSLAILLLILVLGGVIAWQAERINADLPRWLSLATISIALLYLLSMVSGLDTDSFSAVPDPLLGSSWLIYYHLE